MIWSRYSVMLTANSIVLAATAFASDPALAAQTLAFLLPVIGTILCVIWYFISARAWQAYERLSAAAVKKEEDIFGQSELLLRWIDRADDKKARSVKNYANATIFVFAATHCIILLFVITRVS